MIQLRLRDNWHEYHSTAIKFPHDQAVNTKTNLCLSLQDLDRFLPEQITQEQSAAARQASHGLPVHPSTKESENRFSHGIFNSGNFLLVPANETVTLQVLLQNDAVERSLTSQNNVKSLCTNRWGRIIS